MTRTQERKPVLVTGASSGIGAAIAERLVERGFRVFAGVRQPADGQRLARSLGVRCTPLQLDVTDEAQIAHAAAVIRSGGTLYGIVNNAGIAVTAPLEAIPLDALQRQFDVNVFGVVRITQAVLPLLRRSLGRIVNIGSIGARTPLPIVGPYAASKAALDALSAAWRLELLPHGVRVSYIEPGTHRTPIWERSLTAADELESRLPLESRLIYADLIEAMRALARTAERNGAAASGVARTVASALLAREPRARYTVGFDARLRGVLDAVPPALRERLVLGLLGTRPA